MSSFAKKAGHAVEDVVEKTTEATKETADRAHSSLVDLGTQALKLMTMIGAFEARAMDSVLDRVGLQRRESALRPMMYFLAGAVAGGAAAVLLTPKTGSDIRRTVSSLIEKAGGVARSNARAHDGSGERASSKEDRAYAENL